MIPHTRYAYLTRQPLRQNLRNTGTRHMLQVNIVSIICLKTGLNLLIRRITMPSSESSLSVTKLRFQTIQFLLSTSQQTKRAKPNCRVTLGLMNLNLQRHINIHKMNGCKQNARMAQRQPLIIPRLLMPLQFLKRNPPITMVKKVGKPLITILTKHLAARLGHNSSTV